MRNVSDDAAPRLPDSPGDDGPGPHGEPDEAHHLHLVPDQVNVHLEVDYAIHLIRKAVVNGQPQFDQVRLRSYNGQRTGPLIEARPGSTLNVFLENMLPPEPMSMPGMDDMNVPHGFNTTNLHFHGLHVSPAGNSDNVLLAFAPGQQFQYEVKIPRDHPAGTYWYHPHKHGATTLQLGSGLAGPLIIRGNIDEVPAIRHARERIFLFQQIPYVINPATGVGEVENYDNFGPGAWAASGRHFTVNGEVEPVLTLRPGEVQRWRFIHGGIREPLQLRLVRRDAAGVETPISQYQIALDGITTGRIDKVTQTDLFPGYRADVMVRASDDAGHFLPPGVYYLVDAASPAATRDLARVVVQGLPALMALPSAAELAPLAPFKNIPDSELTGTQEAHFDIDLSTTPPRFLVNGKAFDPGAPPRELKLGAVEEWHVSATPVAGHPFHIHVNPFQCTLPDGRVVWKDTIFVAGGASLNLRTRYERYIGRFVLHCHILHHEDLGMMELLEVVPPGDDMHMGGGGH